MSTEDELRRAWAENEQLRGENGELRGRVATLEAQVAALGEQVGSAGARLAELEQQGQRRGRRGKAAAQRAVGERAPRRARAPEHDGGRPREEPTATETHAYERCPDCA